MTDLFQKLAEPFPANSIHWRVGSTTKDKSRGLALAYIDSRDVQERLDAAVGPANWQDRYEIHGPRTICYLSIRIDGEWITKADGAGDTDVEAEKGSISDAFKRAAVKWGVGRYLYDLPTPWVELEQRGRSYAIKQSEYAKLAKACGARPPKQSEGAGEETPFDGPPSDEQGISQAAEYVKTAKAIITAESDATALREWWTTEKDRRREYGLTQAHVNELKAEITARLSRIATEEENERAALQGEPPEVQYIAAG